MHLNGRTKRVDYQIKKQVYQREILGYIENPSSGQGLQLKHFWLSCTVCVLYSFWKMRLVLFFLETVSEAVKHPPDMCIVGWSLSHIVREIYSQLIQLVKYEWNFFSVYYCYLTSV